MNRCEHQGTGKVGRELHGEIDIVFKGLKVLQLLKSISEKVRQVRETKRNKENRENSINERPPHSEA